MKSFFTDEDHAVYVLTSRMDNENYGMLATWVTQASLRDDELRFTVSLSKYNDSTRAIMATKHFILHKLGKSKYELAFKMGAYHSSTHNKFIGEQFKDAPEGRILSEASSCGTAEVLSYLETEDRFILYCRLKNELLLVSDEKFLSKKDLFSQLNQEQKSILEKKFMMNVEQDKNSGRHSWEKFSKHRP